MQGTAGTGQEAKDAVGRARTLDIAYREIIVSGFGTCISFVAFVFSDYSVGGKRCILGIANRLSLE